MTVERLLHDLEHAGVELWFEGERLRFRAPKGALTAELRARLAAARAEIVARLREHAAQTEKSAPLSFSQKSLWFLHQQAPASSAYHVAMSARIRSVVDPIALRQALQALVDRHTSLRTSYPFDGEAPRQRVAGVGVVAFDEHLVSGMLDADLHAAVEADYRRPFDLEHGPVLRASLYTREALDHILLITVHHIAADGWSLLMLFEELTKLYAEATGGPAAGLARPMLDYTDYSAWQEEVLNGPEGERLWTYWREKLAAPPAPLALPTDRPRPPMQSFRGASQPLDLDARLTESVKNLARQEGTTPFVVLLAAFHAFLFRLTGAQDVIIGAPTFARSKAEFIRVVGDFVNSVPLRGTMQPSMSFREFVAQMRRTVLDALDAQEFPLPLMVQRLQPDRDSSRSPLFDTFFVLQRFDQFKELQGLLAGSPSDETVEMGGLLFAPYNLDQQEGQFDLALQMAETDGMLRGVLKFSTDLFDAATVQQFAVDFVSLVEAIDREPDVTLGALPLPAAAGSSKGESVTALLDRLQAADIRLFLDGERLRVSAPKGAMTDALRTAVAARKEEIVTALRNSAEAGDDGADQGAIRRIPRDKPLPVSSVQQRFWFLDRMGPGGAHYNVGGCFRIRGHLDADVLRRAIDELVRRHESLRSRIRERDGVPELEITDSAGASLQLVDVSHLSAEAREQESQRLAGERLRASFDMANGPLSGYQLVRLAPDEHTLTLSIHHIVADGWSMLIAVREICSMYESLLAGRAPTLTPLPIEYVDYAAWEQEQLQSGQMRRHLNYWKQELAGVPSLLELPTDRPRPATQSLRGHRIVLDLDLGLLEPLKHVSRQHEATLFMTLVAAFQVLLHRYSGQDDIVIGSPMANRVVPELEGIIGCFVNNLVLRGRVGGNPTFAEYLSRARQTTLGAFDHRDLPFDLIVDGLRPDRGTNHAPIFQVLLTLYSFPTDVTPPRGLTFEVMEAPEIGTARFDLTLEIAEYSGRFAVAYEYASDLFDNDTIVRMHSHFARLLQAAATDPTCRVQELPLLDPADERLLLGEWNDTSLDHDRGRCVHQLLESSARTTPDAAAVTAGSSTLTYRELDERANQLAQLLVQRQVTPGSLVAICLDRTIDMPVAMAAVLKVGAAYVPLDPTHPADRLRYTLEDAGVACAITVSRFASLLTESNAPLVLLDDVDAELAPLPTSAPAVTVKPEDRAYVIYTSGSTGRPKGVEVEHRNVVAFLAAMRREPGFTERDVLLAVTTLSFDIAGLEFWLPFSVGGRVVIASRTDVLDGERLIGLIAQHGVTVMQATPATWRLMLDAGWMGKRDLKVLCGGEALPRDLAAALVERVGELWNMYGPTETTIWSTVSRIDDAEAQITIGRPIGNTRVYMLERAGHLAPIGVPGELCIGGEGVARGYHNRPELTAEKFVAITLPNGRVERVYRTGDMARFRADGRVEFLGRRDQQVKVRGYRIELGEIEAVLSTHPGVKECVVAVREDNPGDQRIVGYVVQTDGAAFDPEAARTTLRGRLPDYMIPNLFTVLPALPLTPNGKIDRKALPAPQTSVKPIAEATETLMTPAQRRVAAAWREVLRADRVGLHDNFFDIGGHSLLLVKLHAVLKREFGGTLELVELFQWTTVAAQATRLSAVAAPDSALRRAQSRAARQIND